MKGRYKMKIFNYLVSRGNPKCSSKNERELRKYGDESHMSASDKNGSRERIAVDSIKRVKSSSLQILVKKNLVFIYPIRFIQNVHTPQQNTKIFSLSSRSPKYEQYVYIHEVWELPIV